MMAVIRTQIQLTEEQADAVRRAAAARGVSIAEVLRTLVDEHVVARPPGDPFDRARLVVGRFRSGRRTVSRDHDDELTEAFGE